MALSAGKVRLPGGGRPVGLPKTVGPKGIVRQNPYSYKPYRQPTTVPPGTYDPGLDAQLQSAQRGLGDLESDTALQGTRATSDYQTNLAAIATSRARAQQNRDVATGGLQHSFQQLADVQGTRAAAAGFGAGDGTGLAAAMARAGNQQRAQAPIDLSLARTSQDLDTRAGNLAIAFQRGGQDRDSALARAQRENTFYGQDVNAAKIFQATQSGLYTPPVKPANEHVGKGGQVFRTAKLGHTMVYVHPNGSVRAGPPGTPGWNIAVNAKTGKHMGAIR